MLSVAVCTNSPMKTLHRADAVEHGEEESNLLAVAATFVSSFISLAHLE